MKVEIKRYKTNINEEKVCYRVHYMSKIGLKNMLIFVNILQLFVNVSCLEITPDPRDMFPESGKGEGNLRYLRVKEYSNLANRTFPYDIIPVFSSQSLSECSISCLRYFCIAFFFNADKLECTLNYYRFYLPTYTVEDIGSKYYLTFREECPSDQGYLYYPTENFCIKLNTTKISYFDVQYNCVLERAATVRVDSQKKLNILQSYLDTQGYNGDNDFAYIMSNLMQGNKYGFIDGTEMLYFDWMSGQPTGVSGARIVMGGSNQKFKDVNEYELHGFICEKHILKP
ncbi:MRC [Mytilus coruscus]|uniref:MRC n=1 Tax=Mytilus coruscus TaxID=42192 RepID=A0A6J8BQK0_MYTCO|nr:MRC [Mytilus coruscus]